MWLNGRSAVVYGANNPIGASVARAFANGGASVYLAGRSTSKLQAVAQEILSSGGAADVAKVDSMNPRSVNEHLHEIVVKHGSIDVSLNLAFLAVEGPARLCNLNNEQFDAATFTRVRSNFVTMAAVASKMAYQGRGVILAAGAPVRDSADLKGAGPAIGSAAIKALCDQLRLDVGSFGVRVAYLADLPASEEELMEELHPLLMTAPMVSPVSRVIGWDSEGSASLPRTGARTGVATG